jgi:hypothetical protein
MQISPLVPQESFVGRSPHIMFCKLFIFCLLDDWMFYNIYNCLIIIIAVFRFMKMYCRYLNPRIDNNNCTASQQTSYITRQAPTSALV